MKKIVSLVLSAALSLSLSVAYADNTVTGGRNGITDAIADYSRTVDMPAFRVGDKITFNLSNLTSGNEITVISAACDSSGDISASSDSNIQYINQYNLAGASTQKEFTYTIRDLLSGNGIYVLLMNDGTGNPVAKFYYKVAKVELKMSTRIGNDPNTTRYDSGEATGYNIQPDGKGNYYVGFIGTALLNTAGGKLSFSDFAYRFGFTISNGTKQESYYLDDTQEAAIEEFYNKFKNGSKLEISGNAAIVYGTTVYNVPSDMAYTLKAKAVTNK